MLVSMNWIQDYVDLSNENIEELIHRFTLSTAEVEDIIYKGKDIKDVVAAKILSVEDHPNSKKLHLLKVDAGDRVYDCVCGAPNVREGMVVPFAKCGGMVGGMEIGKAELAGYPSEGMCCSEKEIGISDDHSGLMELSADTAIGTDIKELFPIEDIIFEVDNKSLTNRPDLWGHYGIAREFSALTGKPLKPLNLGSTEGGTEEAIPVEVKRSDLVYRYSCIKMDNITKTNSPEDIKIRLTYCGMRPINFLADMTNYIMLELGQPTHAFDARKIDKIVVDTPKAPYEFETLDGTKREIDENTLMIHNNDTPVAVAGIMGGLDSEIVGNTTSVVLESANFDGVCVRKSSSRLGLRTDASMRYEKTLDPELTMTAVERFIYLVKSFDNGAVVASKLSDEYVNKYPTIELTIDKAYVDRYTGIDITDEEIVKTLLSLGFECEQVGDKFNVKVPSWRATKDVTIKADLIEEITRIYGYDNFAIKTTRSALKPVRQSIGKDDEAQVKDILVKKFGMHEVHSYIWYDGKKMKKLGLDIDENVRILNMTTPENGTLRSTMLPTMLGFAYDNRSAAKSFGIFEVGRVVEGLKDNGECNERKKLCFVNFSKEVSEKELYFSTLDIVRCLFDYIKHGEVVFKKAETKYNWQHPKNTSDIIYDRTRVGTICTMHPRNLAKLDKSAAVVCVEIDLMTVSELEVKAVNFVEPSKFPGIDYDLSFILKDGMRYEQIAAAWESKNVKELKSAQVIDMYEADGVKSIAVRLTFSSDERTLSMDEVQPVIDDVIAYLADMGVTLKSK